MSGSVQPVSVCPAEEERNRQVKSFQRISNCLLKPKKHQKKTQQNISPMKYDSDNYKFMVVFVIKASGKWTV